MALIELAAEALGMVGRVLVQIGVELVFELAIKGPGYLLCRLCTNRPDPDGAAVVLAGLGFWLAAGLIAYRWFC